MTNQRMIDLGISRPNNKTVTSVTITANRPNGKTEIVDITAKFSMMNDTLFANLKNATKKAGRGELVSYEVKETVVSNGYKMITNGELIDLANAIKNKAMIDCVMTGQMTSDIAYINTFIN